MFFYSFIFFLLLAPLYKAGNRPAPLLFLELAAIGFLFALAWRRDPVATLAPLPRALKLALALLIVYPLVQIAPLPDAWWRMLPGHAAYFGVLDRFAAPADTDFIRTISVVPSATEYGWLALLPPLASLLVVRTLSLDQVARLLLIMAIFTGGEALLGLLQVGSGGESIFYLRNDQAFGTATGTFVNRNHFAAMLAMMLPVIVGLLLFHVRRERRGRRRRRKVGAESTAQRLLLFASALLILLCLLFTRSRGGIGTALVGLAFSSLLLLRARKVGKYADWIVLALVVAALALAVLIGAAPILERMEPEALRLNGADRLAMYAATLRAAIEFLPFGSGLSTFVHVFPRFQADIAGYVDFAHNDYLQFFMELGLVAPVIVALALYAYIGRMTSLLRRRDGRSFTLLQISAGVGLLPLLLHSLVDFGLHMPGNAVWFATLAGVMLHPGPRVLSGRQEQHWSREHGAGEAAAAATAAAPGAPDVLEAPDAAASPPAA